MSITLDAYVFYLFALVMSFVIYGLLRMTGIFWL